MSFKGEFRTYLVINSCSDNPSSRAITLISSGLTFGYKRTLPHALGIIIGYPIMFLIVGLGLGEVFEQNPMFLEIMKYIGISYLCWMAWHIAYAKGSLQSNTPQGKPFTFWQAVLFQWVNPKAWIMAITSLATFLTTSNELLLQIILMSIITVLVGIITTHSWSLGGVFLKRIIHSSENVQIFNKVVAVVLVGSVVPFI